MNWMPVLKLATEGGSLVLLGCLTAYGNWLFKYQSDESTMAGLLSEEDAEGLSFISESPAIEELDEALNMFSTRYRYWANLYPEFIHPDFALQISQFALSQQICDRERWAKILDKHPKIEPEPIITVQQYVDVLNVLVAEDGLTEAHKNMLIAQCRARGATITATALAKAASYKTYSAANLQYGMLAHKIADKLGYTPPNYPDGKPMYWTTLSIAGTRESQHFEFVMRRELVKALKITGIVLPLRNRVLPTGEIVASSELCDMMGNRGYRKRLHSKDKKLIAEYSSNIDWKTCTLSATDKVGNNIQRELMGNSYTELFYLDEATAYASGSRPCSACQKAEYHQFIKIWVKANSGHYELANCYVCEIDDKLSNERIDATGKKITYEADPTKLPDGTMMEKDGKCFLKFKGKLLEWSQAGYVDAAPAASFNHVNVLTPKSIVRCFENGLTFAVHKSAYKLV